MPEFKKSAILYERMKRQRLLDPILSTNEAEYIKLFKMLQPVAPVHFTRPGDPPKLVHRTSFDDRDLSHSLREKNRLVKGRFAGGRVGYVLQEDLERYAIAFRKPLSKLQPIHEDIMAIIKSSGGISKNQLKDELDYPNSEITKALNALQAAFLIYEDQIDTDWDTGLFDFATEWFELKNDEEVYLAHVSKVVQQFIQAIVFATVQQIKDWSQISSTILKRVLKKLESDGELQLVTIDGLGEGYVQSADVQGFQMSENLHHVFMLDKSDILVRSHMTELKDRYKGLEVLQYLLIDGEFQGAVLGHWRIGPYDIDDIVVELDPQEANERKDEILDAVRKFYSPDRTAILKFNGEDMHQ